MARGASNSLSSCRRELDEIAQLIGLNTTMSLLLNADREGVEVSCGNHHAYYADLLGSAKEAYRAPFPDDRADVVIPNAYPADLSLTFARMKAFHSLNCPASRLQDCHCFV